MYLCQKSVDHIYFCVSSFLGSLFCSIDLSILSLLPCGLDYIKSLYFTSSRMTYNWNHTVYKTWVYLAHLEYRRPLKFTQIVYFNLSLISVGQMKLLYGYTNYSTIHLLYFFKVGLAILVPLPFLESVYKYPAYKYQLVKLALLIGDNVGISTNVEINLGRIYMNNIESSSLSTRSSFPCIYPLTFLSSVFSTFQLLLKYFVFWNYQCYYF